MHKNKSVSGWKYFKAFGLSTFTMLPFLIAKDGTLDFVTVFYIINLAALLIVARYLYAPAVLAFLTIGTIEVHIVKRWGAAALDSRIETALEAPGFEMYGYFSTYLDAWDGLVLVHFAVSMILAVIVSYSQTKAFQNRAKILATIALLVSLPFWGNLFSNRYDRPEFSNYYHPIGGVFKMLGILERTNLVEKRRAAIQSANLNDVNCELNYKNVVVILGETTLKDRMSLYGYEKETTPFLSSIEPAVFNAISPSNQTRYSIPLLLSSASVDQFDIFFEIPSIVSTIGACGFETYWISNQTKRGIHDTYVSTIAGEADKIFYLNEDDSVKAEFDSEIVSKIKSLPDTGAENKAFFIHLNGSHLLYSDRYPSEFAKFGSDSFSTQYDNSIYYSDFILSQLSNLFSDENSIFIYVSDHGEIMGNVDSEFGHGFYPSFQEEYRVPLVVWPKRSAKVRDLLATSSGKVVNLESFNNLLEYLVGMRDSPNLSFREDVFSISPKLVSKYGLLESYVTMPR